MNRKILLLLILAFAVFFSLQAQEKWLGTKFPYAGAQTDYKMPPKGYVPFFINYVGRHGSRYMSKSGADSLVLAVLNDALTKNSLTSEGKQWLTNVVWLVTEQKGKYGTLTKMGVEQQQGIAERMQHLYPDVFKGRGLELWCTSIPRTKQSAQAFVSGLQDYGSEKILFEAEQKKADEMLRFFSFSKNYKAFEKSEAVENEMDEIQECKNYLLATRTLASRFFTGDYLNRLHSGDVSIQLNGKTERLDDVIFANALFEVYAVGCSLTYQLLNAPQTVVWKSPFNRKEDEWIGKVANAHDFLTKGPGVNNQGVQVKVASPLLENLIATSDSAVAGKLHLDAVLRFAHAETIAPLAALMKIKHASQGTEDICNYDKYWKAADVVPMSANIQWVFYTDGKDILVKVLLNEQESAIPVKTDIFPYYSWNEVRSYYESLLNTINKE